MHYMQKFAALVDKVIKSSNVIVCVADARFPSISSR